MYIVFEIQTNSDGTIGTLVYSFTDKNQAESKYHAVLTAAAISNLPKHACVMMSEEGFFLKSECYMHSEAQPEPAPTPEPEEDEEEGE